MVSVILLAIIDFLLCGGDECYVSVILLMMFRANL